MRLSKNPLAMFVAAACALMVDGGRTGLIGFFGASGRGQAVAQAPVTGGSSLTKEQQQELEKYLAGGDQALRDATSSKGQRRIENLDKARAYFEAIRVRYPWETHAMFGLAEVARHQEVWSEARDNYNEYIDSPDGRSDHRAYEGLGRVYLQSKYYRQALPQFRKAKTLNAASATAWEGLAQAYWGLHDADKAYEAISQARELQPNSVDILETFVKTCLQTVRDDPRDPGGFRIRNPEWLDQGLKACNRALSLLRVEWENLPQDADLLERMSGFYQHTIKIIEYRLQDNPQPELVLQLVATGEKDQEVQQLLAVHQSLVLVWRGMLSFPEDIPLMLKAVQLERALHMNDLAIEACEAILKIDPDHAEARAILDSLTE